MKDDHLPSMRQRKAFAGALVALLACVAGISLLPLARCGGSDGSSPITPPEEFADRITTYEGTDHFTYTFPEEDIAFDADELRFYADDTLYVVCKDDVTDAEKIALAEQVDGTIVGHLDMSRATLQIHVGDSTLAELEEMADELAATDAVARAEPETPIFLSPNDAESGSSSSDPQENVEWAQIINAPTAWKYEDLFGEVTVGVIDSGFQMDHPELDGVIEPAPFFGNNAADDHGTAVASIIGAIDDGQGIRGVASGANGAGNVHLYGVWGTENSAVLGSYNSMGGFKGALRHLAQDDLGHGSPARVINCSFGVPSLEDIDDDTAQEQYPKAGWWVSKEDRQKAQKNMAVDSSDIMLETLLDIIADARWGNAGKSTEDFLVVQAAGNALENGLPKEAWMNGFAAGMDENLYDRYVKKYGYPFIPFSEVHARTLVVGASVVKHFTGPDSKPAIEYPLADFSCYGEEWVDICAPGDPIVAATTGGAIRDDWNGTSFSAPMVAGTAAALWAIDPELTATEVYALILNNHGKSGSYARTSYQTGMYRMLDAGAAVEALVQQLEAEETTETEGTAEPEDVPAEEDGVPEQLAALADELGVVPTGTEIFGRPGTNSTLTLVPSDRLDGLLGAELYDYDGDGQVELLVAALDAGDGWETGASAGTWNTVDLVIQVYEVAASAPGLADEVRFAVSGLPEESMLSGAQLFRAEVDGETLLYVDWDGLFNDTMVTTLALRYTAFGSLEVAGGAARFEHYNFANCCRAIPGEPGSELVDLSPSAEDWAGWESSYKLAWADDEGESPDPGAVDAYRGVYRQALSDMGLTWETGRSMFSEDGDTYLRPGYPHPRAGELFQLESGGELVELCGVFSTRPESNEGISLEVFDNTGLLDGWR